MRSLGVRRTLAQPEQQGRQLQLPAADQCVRPPLLLESDHMNYLKARESDDDDSASPGKPAAMQLRT